MWIQELIIAPGREDHLARHGVTVREAEELAFGAHLAFRARQGRYALLGQTRAGRYLKVIVAPRGVPGVYGLVTALHASDRERQLYLRQRRR